MIIPLLNFICGISIIVSALPLGILHPNSVSAYYSVMRDWKCWMDDENDEEKEWFCWSGYCDSHVKEGQPNGCNDLPPCNLDPDIDSCSAGTPLARMKTSQEGLKFLERHEGKAGDLRPCGPLDQRACKLTADIYGLYNDPVKPVGHCTVGIGSLVHHEPCTSQDIIQYQAKYPGGMDLSEVFQLLADDVGIAEHEVNSKVVVQLTQNQFDALVSFTFNMGGKTLSNSNLLKSINTGNCYPSAIENGFMGFTHAGSDAHARDMRRAAEINLFNNGVYS